jgi:tripartite-type tricarboxylate transporter receptor subunit TctC
LVRIIGFAGLFAPALAGAQDFPARTIRIIVAQAPGSSVDVLARVIAQKLTDAWGQQVVVDNRPGANGIIGLELTAKSKPDGYTLAMGVPSALTVNQYIYKDLPYDTLRDFAPVTQSSAITYVLVVNPSLPVKTVQELVAFARARPGRLNYSSAGVGNLMHLSAELFSQQTGVKMEHIPNKGETPAVLDAITGQVAVMFTTMPSVVPHIKSGRLRLVAVCSDKRSPTFADVPTTAEAGVPGVRISGWTGVIAPAGTPADVVNKLQREIARGLLAPDVKENLAAQGAEPVGSTPEQFTAFIKAEQAKWGKVIRESGIRLGQ